MSSLQSFFWIVFIAGMINGMVVGLLSEHKVAYWQRVAVGFTITAIAYAVIMGAMP